MRVIRQEIKTLAEIAQRCCQDPELGRNDLYGELVTLFERENLTLTSTERVLVCDILRKLIHNVEMSLRMAVAERLADDPNAPYELILMLANDCIEVARPVLTLSILLSDSDLRDIIAAKAQEHWICIAKRKNLSPAVTAALAETRERAVLETLLCNRSAHIPPDVYRQILAIAAEEYSLKKPLAERTDLPPAIAQALYKQVSEELKAVLRANFALPQSLLDAAMTTAIKDLETTDGTNASASRLIEKLHSGGQLTAAFLIKSLNQNQYEFFEHGFARLLNIPPNIFRALLKNREIDTVAVACRAVGIDRSVFMSMLRMIRKKHGQSLDISEQDQARVQAIFQNMDKRKAEITIHNWATEESRSPIF